MRSEKKRKKSDYVISPTVIFVDVSVNPRKCVSNFLFSGMHIIGRAPVQVRLQQHVPVRMKHDLFAD
jgi:hypothetical protein